MDRDSFGTEAIEIHLKQAVSSLNVLLVYRPV